MANKRVLIRPVSIAVVIACAVIGAYVGYWLSLTAELRNQTQRWVEARQAEGYTVTHGAMRRRGFPLEARIEIDVPSIVDAGATPRWAWGSGRAQVSIPLFSPSELIIRIEGDQALAVGGTGASREYVGRADQMRIQLEPAGWLPNGRITVRNLVMDARTGTDGFAIQQLEGWAAGNPEVPSQEGEPVFRVTLSLAGVRPSAALALPLARTVERAIIEAELTGSLAPAPWPDALMAWRDAGGTIELNTVAMVYGPLDVVGAGTVALDNDVQPMGAMAARMRGFNETVAALSAADIISAQMAQTFHSILGMLSRSGQPGPNPEVTIPFSLQNRVLSAGPIPLVKIPHLRWSTENSVHLHMEDEPNT
ncbi:MAG: DUF2125 domain-containing protein [Hyphomicrobiales bacterium]|nr:DUF2125 domain-containing protein [Hyphomicrobiales bacterium]